MLGIPVKISCLCGGRDCHLCVYNLRPGTVSFCVHLILKGQCSRIGLLYGSQGGQLDPIVKRQTHGTLLLLKAGCWKGAMKEDSGCVEEDKAEPPGISSKVEPLSFLAQVCPLAGGVRARI